MVEFTYRAGFLSGAGMRLPAACGKAGITRHKQEGDLATPAGRLPLLRVLYRADRVRPPRCAVPLEPISPDDAWCDDPSHPAYNTPIRLPHLARHEKLWRVDDIYNIIGILGWNTNPIIPHHGSAIFLHIARESLAPTEGCLALALPDLLACLGAGLSAVVVEG